MEPRLDSLMSAGRSPAQQAPRCPGLNRVLLLGLCLGLMLVARADQAFGQYIFADTNHDGCSTSADTLGWSGTTGVEIWLVTDRNRDGSEVRLPLGSAPLSILAYEVALAAVDGTVRWGEYKNELLSTELMLGRLESPTEFYIAYGGMDPQPPGRYKLGTLEVEVQSGRPRLEFRAGSTLHRAVGTAFGSLNPGKDGDYALKFGPEGPESGDGAAGKAGDWADADGVGSPSRATALAAGVERPPQLVFGIKVTRNVGRPSEIKFAVTTTRVGFVRVRLFDPQGRVVRTLMEEGSVSPGEHVLSLRTGRGRRAELASGVYFYRVETSEAVKTGRVVVIR